MTEAEAHAALWDAINAWSAGTGELPRLVAALDAYRLACRAAALEEAAEAAHHAGVVEAGLPLGGLVAHWLRDRAVRERGKP